MESNTKLRLIILIFVKKCFLLHFWWGWSLLSRKFARQGKHTACTDVEDPDWLLEALLHQARKIRQSLSPVQRCSLNQTRRDRLLRQGWQTGSTVEQPWMVWFWSSSVYVSINWDKTFRSKKLFNPPWWLLRNWGCSKRLAANASKFNLNARGTTYQTFG